MKLGIIHNHPRPKKKKEKKEKKKGFNQHPVKKAPHVAKQKGRK